MAFTISTSQVLANIENPEADHRNKPPSRRPNFQHAKFHKLYFQNCCKISVAVILKSLQYEDLPTQRYNHVGRIGNRTCQ